MGQNQKINFPLVSVLLGLVAILIVVSFPAFADKSAYEEATIRRLTDHLFQEKMIDFEDPNQFKEYTMIEDCEIFDAYFSNDFEWNRIRIAIKQEMDGLEPSVKRTKLRVPGRINITRYNFTTQSFDIDEDDIFDAVGFLQISESLYSLCDKQYDEGNVKTIPRKYFLKPDIAFNLFRIPVSKTVAKKVLDRIPLNEKNSRADYDTRTVHININMTLDAFFEIRKEGKKKVLAYVLGTVDSVDFYMDAHRKNKFKTISYDVY